MMTLARKVPAKAKPRKISKTLRALYGAQAAAVSHWLDRQTAMGIYRTLYGHDTVSVFTRPMRETMSRHGD